MLPSSNEILRVVARRKAALIAAHAMVTAILAGLVALDVLLGSRAAHAGIHLGLVLANLAVLAIRLAAVPRRHDLERLLAQPQSVLVLDHLPGTHVVRVVFIDGTAAFLALTACELKRLAPTLARHCPFALIQLPWLVRARPTVA